MIPALQLNAGARTRGVPRPVLLFHVIGNFLWRGPRFAVIC